MIASDGRGHAGGGLGCPTSVSLAVLPAWVRQRDAWLARASQIWPLFRRKRSASSGAFGASLRENFPVDDAYLVECAFKLIYDITVKY